MDRWIALGAGIAAWTAVAVIAVVVVNAWSESNRVAAFFPIAAAVLVAWLVGEWVTERVFVGRWEEDSHGGA
jgi:hypothetical protein